nr:hypothetical protein [Tanacetum cinerariifolium]
DWLKEFVKHGLKIRKQGELVWSVGGGRAPVSHSTGSTSGPWPHDHEPSTELKLDSSRFQVFLVGLE